MNAKAESPARLYPRRNCRKILGSYRQVRRRGAAGWSTVFSAGALAIRGFGRSRWLPAAGAVKLWDLIGCLNIFAGDLHSGTG